MPSTTSCFGGFISRSTWFIASMARAIIFSLVSWANGSSFFLDGVRFRCLLGLPLLGPLLLTPRALLSFGLISPVHYMESVRIFPSAC